MKCNNCKSVSNQLYPIDPIGSKHRRWICIDCMRSYPYPISRYMYSRGQRRTLRLNLIVIWNKLLDHLKIKY